MFLFSCTPVCLLPLPSSPAVFSVLFSFLLLTPLVSLCLSISLWLLLLALLQPPDLSLLSLPEELHSVVDIFPASLDKNKLWCFFWSWAEAFVSVTSFCLSNRSLFSVTVKSNAEKKRRRKKKRTKNAQRMEKRQRVKRRWFVMGFSSFVLQLTKPLCVHVCACRAGTHDRSTPFNEATFAGSSNGNVCVCAPPQHTGTHAHTQTNKCC